MDKVYPCPLDESVSVIEMPFGPEALTLAFIVMADGVDRAGVIVLDSEIYNKAWFTNAHKIAIFAHELGHLAMGESEHAADEWAIRKLGDLGEREARQLLLDRL